VSGLTPLHLDPLGLQGGHVQPLLGVDLAEVVAGGQSPQRVPGALVPPVGSHRSLVLRDGRGQSKDGTRRSLIG